MPKKTHFSDDWLKRKDSNGVIVEFWCEKTNRSCEAFCKYCKKIIQCGNRGFGQLFHHSQGKHHITSTKALVNGNQMQIKKTSALNNESKSTTGYSRQVQPSSIAGSSSLTLWSQKDAITKAEIIWSLKTAGSNFAYDSSDFIGETFKAMFPDSEVASRFQMSRTKMSYMITEATGPYFHSLLLEDIKNSESIFSLCFDELTNKQVKKQLDIKICYWSKDENQIKVSHLATHLMGQAKAVQIKECLIRTLNENGLMLKDLITLGSDGPNVNKAVFNLMCEERKKMNLPALLNIGTCSLHIAHGAFYKGIKEYGQLAVDLIIDLFNFFKLSPVRREELNDIQIDLDVEESFFLKHTETRWVTLISSAERVLSQWPAIKRYFIIELPKRDSKISQNNRYKRVMECIQANPLKTRSQLHFLVNAAVPFEKFLKRFQKEEPLIHALHEEMCLLIKSLLTRFLKVNEVSKLKSVEDLVLIKFPNSAVELDSKDLQVGAKTREVLHSMKPQTQQVTLYGMRKFYYAAAQYLLSTFPLTNTILQNASCLNYSSISQESSCKSIKELAKSVCIEPPLNEDLIADEWKLLQCENIPKEWYSEITDDDTEIEEGDILDEKSKRSKVRIDHFWSKIFSLKTSLGDIKFPELSKLIKAILVLPHGNSDVERGFSQTTNYLTSKRTRLSSASISALQSTKDGLKKYKNHFHKIPISKDFLNKGHSAYKSYKARIEKEKLLKEERRKNRQKEKEKFRKEQELKEQKQRELTAKSAQARKSIKLEQNLGRKEEEAKEELDNYTSMIEEANARIRDALRKNDLNDAKIGQTFLEAAVKKMEESKSSLEKVRREQKEVETNKRTLLHYFTKSPNKKHKKQ